MESAANICVVGRVESLDDRIIVRFSDGATAIFDAQFLYQHRTEPPNRVLSQEGDLEKEQS